jgi:HSP20 family protein
MLSLRTSSPYGLIDRLEQQLNQQLNQQPQITEHVPAAEVHQTETAYTVLLELPGVDKTAIDVKATDRTLVISAERRSSRDPLSGEGVSEGQSELGTEPDRAPLLSEFRYGTWTRSFRFPVAIERDQLEATYRDGLLTVTAPKANKVSTVTVKVAG